MDLQHKWNRNTPDWLFQRKSGTMIYRVLFNAQSKQTGERMKTPQYLFCGDLLININGKAEIYQWESDWGEIKVFQRFGLKHYWLTRFCNFSRSWGKPSPGHTSFSQTSQQDYKWKPCRMSWPGHFSNGMWKFLKKPQSVLWKKVHVSKFSTSSFHVPNNFSWKQTCSVSSNTHKVLPRAPFRVGQADLPAPQAGFRRSHRWELTSAPEHPWRTWSWNYQK